MSDTRNFDVVVAGSYVQDLAFKTPSFPAPGETRIGHFQAGPGGKGFNQAVASHRQNARTLYLGAVGNDLFADGLLKFIKQEGISAELQTVDDLPTGAASIVVNEKAQNMIVVALGACERLSVSHIKKFEKQIKSARVVLTQVESNLSASVELLKIAKDSGAIKLLNPAPINHDISRELVEACDVLIPNETEFAFLLNHLYGQDIKKDIASCSESELREYCALVGVPTVVLTLGEKGCFVCHNRPLPGIVSKEGKTSYMVPSISVKSIDTTGAGDAFCGGLSAGLVRFPDDFEKAVRYATVVAGLSTERAGTAPAMPSSEEVGVRFG